MSEKFTIDLFHKKVKEIKDNYYIQVDKIINNYIFINDSPDYYKHLWVMNVIEQFGTLIELHILESAEVKL